MDQQTALSKVAAKLALITVEAHCYAGKYPNLTTLAHTTTQENQEIATALGIAYQYHTHINKFCNLTGCATCHARLIR